MHQNWYLIHTLPNHLCGVMSRVPSYSVRGPRFDSRHYQIFGVVAGLEQGPLAS
jgi:hypothetical protein